MGILKSRSIKKKVMLTGMLTTGISLLMAGILNLVIEIVEFRSDLIDNVTVQARMIGNSSVAALTFSDWKDADETLRTLGAAPNIISAALYTRDNRIFAMYQRDAGSGSFPPAINGLYGHRLSMSHFDLVQPVFLKGELLGKVFIRSDLKSLYSGISRHVLYLTVILLGSLLVAFFLMSRLQKSVTDPILNLAGLTRTISDKKDYSVRAAVSGNDEVGTLAAGFNEMLENIQDRDSELRMHREHLEDLVIKRTTELEDAYEQLQKELTDHKRTEEKLNHAMKMEAIGQLTGGIAHDFNNILTTIIGYGNLLQMKMDEKDPLNAYVAHMLSASQKAANLTQSLLAFSRKQIINPKPIDLNKVVKSVEKLLVRLIGEDIELRTILNNPAPALPAGRVNRDRGGYEMEGTGDIIVMADAVQIEQVLMNLATNARDSMPRGGVLTITTAVAEVDRELLQTYPYMKQGRYSLITVTDTGIGMDEKIRERIFEPFFTTKEVGKGTGLGLAMAYGIVKQHEGYINVSSEPGQGTTFRIYLPLIEAEVENERPDRHSAMIGGREKILFAEDDGDVRGLTKSVLGEAGYTVVEAVDGEDAISKFAEDAMGIDLLLLDVIMPKKSGMAVYEEVKKARPDVRVLFVSGYTADIIRQKGMLDDGMVFIEKPVEPGVLLKKIREVLDEKNGRAC
ncbi:MAG: response regulator [Nitrospirae bacterium]|nr:response regulator [Nitrospirota bacterium]